MAVDQVPNFNLLRDMYKYNNVNNNNNTMLTNYLQIPNVTPNEAMFNPTSFYGLNDAVFNVQKLTPAVKDDSGVTFNNSFQQPPRKRRREAPVQAPISCPAVPPMVIVNPISSTCSSGIVNTNAKSSGCGLSFLGEDLSLQIMQQQLEVDRLISHHVEKMKVEIEERKKQEYRRMVGVIEEAIVKRMREKEVEIERVGKINYALEERVKSLVLENQIWRDLAQTNEATANALRTNLEQVLHNVDRTAENATGRELQDDAESCCGSSGEGGGENGEEVNGGNDGKKWVYRGGENRRMCRKCGEGESSVLLLPCRHLCLCTSCGPAVNSCPICNATKNASVHVNLS